MTRLIFVILALAGFAGLHANDAAIIAEVMAADDARVAAMATGDSHQLDAVLSDSLHYAHSAKLIENKSQHIASLASRRLIYWKFDWKVRDFNVVAPGVVLSKGRALVQVGSTRRRFLVDINFVGVWRLEDQRWRLYAWQSSRNEEVIPLSPPAESEPARAAEPTTPLQH